MQNFGYPFPNSSDSLEKILHTSIQIFKKQFETELPRIRPSLAIYFTSKHNNTKTTEKKTNCQVTVTNSHFPPKRNKFLNNPNSGNGTAAFSQRHALQCNQITNGGIPRGKGYCRSKVNPITSPTNNIESRRARVNVVNAKRGLSMAFEALRLREYL